jgi:predicted  nucleic acid-binding Zn-ribbon protein
MMDRDKVRDITVEILISIRDEIRNLREDTDKRFEQLWTEIRNLRVDTNNRFEQMDKRFEQMDKRFEHIEADIRVIVSHFERDYILLANKLGVIEGRFDAHMHEMHR